MKRLFAIGLLLAVAACTTPRTPAQGVYAAKSTYAAALTVAVEYRNLPPCQPGGPAICRDAKVMAVVLKADDVAAVTLDQAETTVRDARASGDTLDKAVLAAEAAVASFKAITATLKTK